MKTKLAVEILFHISCRLDLFLLARLLSACDLLSVYSLKGSLKLKLPGYRSFYICYILSGLFPDALD